MPSKVRIQRAAPARGRVSLAQRRKKWRIVWFSLAGVLLIALVAGFLYVVRLPELSIQTVTVSGAYALSADDIRTAAERELSDSGLVLIPRHMIFAYPRAALEAKLLQEFPQLQSVNITRDSLLGTTLQIKVVERTTYGIWCNPLAISSVASSTELSAGSADACYEMDASGFIFAPADGFAEYYLFYGGVATDSPPITQHFYPEHIDTLRALLAKLSPVGLDPHIIRVQDGSDVDIELLGGMHIKASLDMTSEESISALQTALSSDALKDKRDTIQYIDVRFGNRVYFKFKE